VRAAPDHAAAKSAAIDLRRVQRMVTMVRSTRFEASH
jgi:hypothetical protein